MPRTKYLNVKPNIRVLLVALTYVFSHCVAIISVLDVQVVFWVCVICEDFGLGKSVKILGNAQKCLFGIRHGNAM